MKICKQYISAAAKVMLFGALLGVCSCNSKDFKIKGEIYGADNQSVVLEKSDFHGYWVAIDSTRTSKNGSFSIKSPSPASPEIFRLCLGDKFIYFPIDENETLTLSTSSENFGKEYTLSGSDNAEALTRFESELNSLPRNISADSLKSFKRQVYTKYMQPAQGSIVAYYILTKTLGGDLLFNPEDKTDAKYFAAVATGFKEVRPDDPHTPLLEKTTLEALKRHNAGKGTPRQFEAQEITMVDIDLPDETGKNVKLSEVVGKGKPVVVIFSLLTYPESPAINMDLSKVYNSRPGSVEFYHVSLDPDQFAWRDAARNLPWITVYDANGQYSPAAASYNVGSMPTYFIYDSAGNLAKRVASASELQKSLAGM